MAVVLEVLFFLLRRDFLHIREPFLQTLHGVFEIVLVHVELKRDSLVDKLSQGWHLQINRRR